MCLRLKTSTKSIFIVLVSASLLAIILLYNNKIDDKRLQDNFINITNNPDYKEALKIDKFPVYKQSYSWSCGPTTISMVCTYLKEPKNEKQVLYINKITNRKSGMLPKTFERYLRNSLQKYNVEMISNIPDSEIIRTMYNQLKQGLPVPIYFSTLNYWDKPNYDTHYSAAIGIDLVKGTVTIANAYGFEEEVNVNDFLASLKYDNYKNKPLAFRLATLVGVIKENNIYILSKN
jgi:hypothetical protein